MVPFLYYYGGDFHQLNSLEPPVCQSPCWWVMRQPYTATHAFSQTVIMEDRPWKTELPEGCDILDRWDGRTGLMLWNVSCEETELFS